MPGKHTVLRPADRPGARHSRSRTRRPRPTVLAGLVAVTVLLFGAGLMARGGVTSGFAASGRPAAAPSASPSASARTSLTPHPSRSASPSASPSASASPSTSTSFPQRGTGTFTRATGGTKAFGHGTPLRYAVDVEGGMGQDASEFARQVDAVLDNTERGWTAGGQWSFQRVATGPVDFTVHLTSPGTTDDICAKYGLDTGGWVNCSGGYDVVINVKRWLLLTPYYEGKPDLYHALAVNHEVGHRLGRNHVTCPGPGQPAPVMMQQIKGLHGCVINGWPYDDDGQRVTGPAAA